MHGDSPLYPEPASVVARVSYLSERGFFLTRHMISLVVENYFPQGTLLLPTEVAFASGQLRMYRALAGWGGDCRFYSDEVVGDGRLGKGVGIPIL